MLLDCLCIFTGCCFKLSLREENIAFRREIKIPLTLTNKNAGVVYRAPALILHRNDHLFPVVVTKQPPPSLAEKREPPPVNPPGGMGGVSLTSAAA